MAKKIHKEPVDAVDSAPVEQGSSAPVASEQEIAETLDQVEAGPSTLPTPPEEGLSKASAYERPKKDFDDGTDNNQTREIVKP